MTSRTWVSPKVMFGWARMFDSGLNVSAIGQSDQSSSSEPVPVGYFRVGYAF